MMRLLRPDKSGFAMTFLFGHFLFNRVLLTFTKI